LGRSGQLRQRGPDNREQAPIGNHDLWAGIIPLVGHLTRRVHRIGRRHNGPSPQCPEVTDYELRAIGHHQRHAVSLPHSERLKPRRQMIRVVV
jgi:hypothetical protein